MNVHAYHWIYCIIIFITAAGSLKFILTTPIYSNLWLVVAILFCLVFVFGGLYCCFSFYHMSNGFYQEEQQQYNELMKAANSGKVISYYDIEEWQADAKEYNDCIQLWHKRMTYPNYKKAFFGVNDHYDWNKLPLIDENLVS